MKLIVSIIHFVILCRKGLSKTKRVGLAYLDPQSNFDMAEDTSCSKYTLRPYMSGRYRPTMRQRLHKVVSKVFDYIKLVYIKIHVSRLVDYVQRAGYTFIHIPAIGLHSLGGYWVGGGGRLDALSVACIGI